MSSKAIRGKYAIQVSGYGGEVYALFEHGKR